MRPLGDGGWKARMLALQAIARAGDKAVAPEVIKSLANWDAAKQLDTAKLDQPAPEFELSAINGDRVRLRD